MSTTGQLSRGGIGTGSRGSNTVWHTGEHCPSTTTTGTDTTPVVTETYIAQVFIPHNSRLTGVSLLNGSAVAGNVKGILYNSNGVPVAQTASTAQSGTAAYQQIAFTTAYDAVGPGLYYIGLQFNNTSARFRTHILGNFAAFKKTGETYGTATNITPVATFTTALGPFADTY